MGQEITKSEECGKCVHYSFVRPVCSYTLVHTYNSFPHTHQAKMERRVVYSTCSKLYKPPLTMKGPSSTTTKDREEIMDTILNQMAISTSNTIRQLSMIETQDCAPLKINLDQQFTETLSPTIIPVLTNSANKQSVRAVYNFYEPEPELCEVWKTRAAFRGTSVHVASGRRNPVAHTLDSMYFIPISNATHKL